MMRWNSTKTYTEDDIIRMQQEAVNRVHEFQERAQGTASFFDMPTIGEASPLSPPEYRPVIEAESHVIDAPDMVDTAPQSNDPIRGFLEKLNIDTETLLILGLMFLLYNEKADNLLLIALAYLLL